MAHNLKNTDLALGLEIRDKVSNFVAERIKAIRINSNEEKCSNISILKTNAMKLLLNYFYKGQISKIFFCFADPHFKKCNHKRRIINKYLLQDYAYVLGIGGILYSITDVEDLHKWHVEIVNSSPCFEKIEQKELENDEYLSYMKDTDEAKKVKKINGEMYYTAWKRIEPKISSFEELVKHVGI